MSGADESLQAVADVYLAAVKAGRNPTRAVQDTFGLVSKSAAAQRVSRARAKRMLPPTTQGRSSGFWRVGENYGIHVYEGNRPVATFHEPADAERAVQAVNAPSAPFVCAECGTTTAGSYVVTGAVDDREGRTEVCRPCDDALTLRRP